MNYIPLADVINEVKVFYNSFFESGFDLDESVFLPAVRLLLRKCSPVIHPIDSESIEINNYKACLPDNFYLLRRAYLTSYKEIFMPPHELEPTVITSFYSDYKINSPSIHICGEENINVIQRLHDGTWIKYPEVERVSVTSKITKVHGNNFDHKSEVQIDIKDNNILSNVCEGTIFIEYFTILEENGDIIIPDDEFILAAFREKIKETILEYLLINTTAQVSNLYQVQVDKARKAVRHMVSILKTPEYDEMSKLNLANRRLFNRLNNGY